MEANYDIFDIDAIDDFFDEDALPPTVLPPVYDDTPYLERSHNYWMQVPIPIDVVPTGGAPLSQIDDETLLGMCPTLIAHMQRTAAQGGLQVVSPRAASLAAMFSRTNLSTRTTDMFLVGSTASQNLAWPTIDGDTLEELFPDDPVSAFPAHQAARAKTKTIGIIGSSVKTGDPIATAFLKGRALVDLQRRADVGGAGQHLASCLAASWGLEIENYEELAEATLAPVGQLLRYAIRSDDAYPQLNAPVEAKKCISVGANTGGRELYGEYAAIDWRRLRVGMEAVFHMSVRTEGYSLVDFALDNPPGDPRAPPNRPGILQFRPNPGTVWTFAPETFRLDVATEPSIRTAAGLPAHTLEAVRSFYGAATVLAIAADYGTGHALVPTLVAQPSTLSRDTIVAGYTKIVASATTFSARGKTAVAAIRDYVYQTLVGTSTVECLEVLWVSRYLGDTVAACGLTGYLDSALVRIWANRLAGLVWDLRVKLGAEAARRGEDLDIWWAHVNSLLPTELKTDHESAHAWARAIAHFTIYPYSRKWANLVRAAAIRAHELMPSMHPHSLRLPVKLRSRERVYEAGVSQVRALGKTYGAYYGAMRTVCELLAHQASRRGAVLLAHRLTTAGLMWDIRSKAASTARLHCDEPGGQAAGHRLMGTGHYHISTSPYAAYGRWFAHISQSRLVLRAAKQGFPAHAVGLISHVFAPHTQALYHLGPLASARAFRYVAQPHQLAADIEQTLQEMWADTQRTLEFYEREQPLQDFQPGPSTAVLVTPIDFSRYKPPQGSYWDTLLHLEPGLAVALEETVDALPEDVAQHLQTRMYHDGDELVREIQKACDVVVHHDASTAEALQ